jgi:ketosteroid isomerase-like protein
MTRAFGAGIAAVVFLVSIAAQEAIPPALAAMADTEREFARTATVKGWRDAFLDFFADDAIAFAPSVIKAKDRLRKQPSKPFSELELVWEPRTGDVASSGDLGWLTGPSTSINHTTPEKTPGYGCYLSVWRKQPDGTWRVFIDVGAGAPSPVPFASGFTRIALPSRYTAGGGKEAAEKSLAEADRDLNSAIASQGTASAFTPRLTSASRIHRPGTVPTIGPEAITKWLDENTPSGSAQQTAVESSAAGDFGYSYGRFEMKGAKPSTGVYVRLWSRDASGKWWLVADVAQVFQA